MSDKRSTEEEELAELFPEPRHVPIGKGVMLAVPAMDLATCIRFAKASRSIIEQLMLAAGDQLTLQAMLLALWPALIDAPDSMLLEVLAVALGKTPEFVGKLPPGALMPVIEAIHSVNRDFFIQSVGSPVSGAQATSEKPAADGAGLTH